MPPHRRVAIIGMALRLPGANTPEGFWHTIHRGISRIHRFTERELRAAGVPETTFRAEDFVGASAPLRRVPEFDAEFFSMSAREAALTDPQQRIFLECAHHALEDAGYAGTGTQVGVFASTGYHLFPYHTYGHRNLAGEPLGDTWVPTLQRDIGNHPDYTATRAAFRLGLTGPAVGIQNACSSSLVAVHLARQALLTDDAELAVVGAAAVHVPQILGYHHAPGSILSRTGRCLAFDAASDGTVGGNGVAAVVLKRLDRALADRDTVHAVILGSALNNDGAAKKNYTEPSVDGQWAVIRRALASAGVSADTVGYVETHGTGTYKGDPIEFAALTGAFREDTERRGFCGIGSAKPNIGHLDVCGGLAGLIKAVLALRHATIPPLAGFTAPNPLLDLDTSPFYLPSEARPWPAGDTPRRAGVTSLGVGGTNAHVIVEEAEEAPRARSGAVRPPGAARPGLAPPCMVPLYGHNSAALDANARALRARLRTGPAPAMADLVTTLALGRRALRHRLVLLGDTPAALAAALDDCLDGGLDGGLGDRPAPRRYVRGEAPHSPPTPPVWLFSGQGGAAVRGAAAALYARFSVVREVLDACEEQYRDEYGGSLLRVLTAAGSEAGAARYADDESTETLQPALFALQAALTRLWQRLTGPPAAVAGHSAGEWAALFAAGALSLADGLRLTAARGRLMRRDSAPGGMIAAFTDEATVRLALADLAGLELAVVNGARHHVLAGPHAALAEADRWFEARGVRRQRLPVDRAFHSALLDPALDGLREAAGAVRFGGVQVPFVSGLDGRTRPPGWAPDPDYAVRQARWPVRFDLVLRELAGGSPAALVELGPGEVLTALARRELAGVRAFPTLRRRRGLGALWDAAARLHCQGHGLDWGEMAAGCAGGRVPLPGYRFQRKTHWTGPELVEAAPAEGGAAGPGPGRDMGDREIGAALDQVLGRIIELTAHQLGFGAEEVGPDVPFFDLGADSLQMINMLREVEREFAVKVAMRELFEEADTPRLLAEAIVARMSPPPAPEVPRPEPVPEVTAAADAPYVTREAYDELARQVQELARNQLLLMSQLSQLLERSLPSDGAPTLNGRADLR
ncbi:type I polyketide synthase [Streptomyces sp. NPDC059590]|uniref:type I polyketide synthase n=1 Tax=Streptomyces sp. NPDC059590 TaxID=3346877 RepID=UPI003689D365